MPRADFTLPGGAEVSIEGTVEEVRALLDYYRDLARRPKGSGHTAGRRPRQAAAASANVGGPMSLVRQLIKVGFFKTGQSLKAIKHKLAEKGHIYPETTLSSTLIRLTKAGELTRRKDGRIWTYLSVDGTDGEKGAD